MTAIDPFLPTPRIAYFSMEMALDNRIPTYSGGLGVLAGDTLRASADLALPLVGVTLVSRGGYFRQEIDADGRQLEHPAPWQPEQRTAPLKAKIAVAIEGRDVWVQAWLYVLEGGTGYRIPVILLDTDVEENSAADREITHYLYGGDEAYRLKQEVVLGLGGVRMLQALGFSVHTYHMNEGHSALLAVELLRRSARPPETVGPGEESFDASDVREVCLFTTHTPVEAGHDQFSYGLAKLVLGDTLDLDQLRLLAGAERLNMTRLALSLSGYVNGVAKSHAAVSNSLFPGYLVHAITNGVHGPTWTAPSIARLYDEHLPDWRHEPEVLVRADQLGDDRLWAAHVEAKQNLIAKVRAMTGESLDPALPILGFARRMTAYKRPDLLFSDADRLLAVHERWPFQLVMAGKAHPRDLAGKALIETVHAHIRRLRGRLNLVYLPDYDLEIALAMVSGSDVWLNNPLRPLEASGTSGMKAAFNGVLNFSVLDGWWAEGCIEGVTGWAIGTATSLDANGRDALSLYAKLEATVLPLYYQDRPAWIAMMKGAICKNAYYFNSHRMMRRYATEAYLR